MNKTDREQLTTLNTTLDALKAQLQALDRRLQILDARQASLETVLPGQLQEQLPGTPRVNVDGLAAELNGLAYRIKRLELYTKRPL